MNNQNNFGYHNQTKLTTLSYHESKDSDDDENTEAIYIQNQKISHPSSLKDLKNGIVGIHDVKSPTNPYLVQRKLD